MCLPTNKFLPLHQQYIQFFYLFSYKYRHNHYTKNTSKYYTYSTAGKFLPLRPKDMLLLYLFSYG